MVDTRTQPRSRKTDILAAAEREFAAAGYAGARMDRIAAEAGVNKQLLFHYFDSKSGLFAAVLESVFSRHDPQSQHDDPVAAVRASLVALEMLARSNTGMVTVLAAAAAEPAFPSEAAAVARGWMLRVHQRIAAAVEDAQRRGYYRDDIDPAQVARLGVAAALGAGAFAPPSGPAASVVSVLQEYCAWR